MKRDLISNDFKIYHGYAPQMDFYKSIFTSSRSPETRNFVVIISYSLALAGIVNLAISLAF